jgi:hypothetical protein
VVLRSALDCVGAGEAADEIELPGDTEVRMRILPSLTGRVMTTPIAHDAAQPRGRDECGSSEVRWIAAAAIAPCTYRTPDSQFHRVNE